MNAKGAVDLPALAAQILGAIDVSTLVGDLIALKRVGRELTGLCPFHDDRSPSFSMNADSVRFYCFGCGAKGDVFDLVGHVWGVRRFRGQLIAVARWGGLAWALDRLEHCDHLPAEPAPMPAPKPITKPPARRPVDPGEVAALWARCHPVIDDAAVAGYLRTRKLDPLELAERDLARAIPEEAVLPRWASFARIAWNRSGHRLLLPLFNAQGVLASLSARRILKPDDNTPKCLFPPGPRKGFLLADDAGRWMLRAPQDYLPAELWIAEGLTDFLAMGCGFTVGDECAAGTLGIVGPGSWTRAAADRIPDRVVVVVAVDPDAAGDAYIDEVLRTFEGRPVHVDRWRPKQEREWS